MMGSLLPGRFLSTPCSRNLAKSGGSPLKVFDNVIRNLLDSWLDSKIPDFIPEIPVHQIRKAYVT